MIKIILTLEETQNFIKYDGEEASEIAYITELILTSEDYLIDAIGTENYDIKILNKRFERKARLCCLVIIQDCYDSRSFISKSSEKIRLIISGMLFQMQYATFEPPVVI